MNFFNLSFLMILLPISFIIYFVIQNKYRKYFLLIISFIFYLTYGVKPLIVLGIFIIYNYILRLSINKFKKALLFIGICYGLGKSVI